jgi:Asp/Glu/hydantoin racemase
MGKVLALVHSTSVVVGLLGDLARSVLPEVEVLHLCDDTLLRGVRAACGLTPAIAWRYVSHVIAAAEAGADAVMVTCSSCNRVADLARPFVRVPVFSIDEAMAEQAVAQGQRIGVVATLATTLEPTADLLQRKALAQGRLVEVVTALAQQAFDRLAAGDLAGHDAAVLAEVQRLAADCDVIVLAQVSMARLAPRLGEAVGRPVLTSARLGLERARAVLGLPPTL